MRFSISNQLKWGLSLLSLAAFLFLIFKGFFRETPQPVQTSVVRVFSDRYPASEKFSQELLQLKASNKLSPGNENLINSSVESVARVLDQPPSLLWCLLFQESRLNHLSDIDEPFGSTGLGQFSASAFFEINKELYRYFESPPATVRELLGKDARPIVPDRNNITSLHSYYHIPTAVAASALFLHNRWIQLKRIATYHQLPYSQELLWAWAALSYNKGSRTILSLWKQIEKKKGRSELENALINRDSFLNYTNDLTLLKAATSSIWPSDKSRLFAQELHIHSQNLNECAFSVESKRSEP